MERRVSDNAEKTSGRAAMTPDGVPLGWYTDPPEGEEAAEATEETDLPRFPVPTGPTQAEAKPQGSCLYLGPAGQRCNRPAASDGFCATHQSGGGRQAIGNPARVLAATAAIVALLWPYIDMLVREILRWAHWR